ncbi:MAG TPA: DNA repair protein RecO, partial [Gammaproteobacteria bacterium]|nr:DNA repair protein RecO [Gammaproteobacteria bacterium]
RVAIVARGAKRGQAKVSNILQPFVPLQVAWFGNGDLVTLTAVETIQPGPCLHGRSAFCGLYINELLMRLLPKWDTCPALFAAYEAAITQLAVADIAAQIVLRKFEMQLLKSLGYGLQLHKEVASGAAIVAESYYLFDPVLGPRLINGTASAAFKGASLLALANEAWHAPGVLLDIKRLMRFVLRYHLGTKQLVSRELF